MNSSKVIKGLKIGISVLFRLAILGYPGLTALILGGYNLKEEYSSSFHLCFFIIYLIIVIMDLFFLIIPCFHNRINMIIIIIIDIISIIANIIFAIFATFHWESSTIAAVSIPGTLYHVIMLIILIIWSAIPIIKRNGFSSLFTPMEFYYGCLFIKKSEICCLDDDDDDDDDKVIEINHLQNNTVVDLENQDYNGKRNVL